MYLLKPNFAVVVALLFISMIVIKENKITVFLIGDSTMSEKEEKAFPETGWGMCIKSFFDSSVVFQNHAKNGRSTRTFLSENRWQPVVEQLKQGDYVLIQFGHNDEVKEKKERYTTPEEYKKNLLTFIKETKIKGGIPILLTPVGRRKFDSTGNVMESHPVYSDIVRQLAKEQKVSLIDLDKKSQFLYQQMGEQNSKSLFLWLEPGEHPNYPNGKQDNTHFNTYGALKIAELVASDIESLPIDLAKRIKK